MERKKLGLSGKSKLELSKTVGSGTVKQSFSHGRVKSVAVEVKKIRTFRKNNDGANTVNEDSVDDKKADNIAISENKIESKLTPEFPIKILFSKFGIKIINKEIIIETYNRLLVPVIIRIAIIQYMHKPMAIPFRPSEKFKALYIKKIQKKMLIKPI